VGKVVLDKGLKVESAAVGAIDDFIALARHGKSAAVVLTDPHTLMRERAKAEPDVVGDLRMPKQPDEEQSERSRTPEHEDAFQ